ncbi:YceD family protein [Novosphingobium sediminicola]|uniref:Uncharacterized metal-binding protein YceD (DUF177 family) n=1 Tax=Novosphingobium sediminicola TaxID=563162 RepID=A0A7W6CD19_9SPHN|nr:DUF177 domain-containing protein [Novosphingobium sediminicola]MBB3954301.1 uncharacterized metal-binding protein YceD (DUF177 family) [Novosphingobium sediminicola]
MSDTPEFSRILDIRHLDEKPVELTATIEECKALAKRFHLVSIGHLRASVTIARDGAIIRAKGTLSSDLVQSCAISAEDLPQRIREKLDLRFVPESGVDGGPDEEIELSEEDCDDIPYEGERFDLGEAVAQSLALSIDPFAEGPEAAKVRAAGLLGQENLSPFAALEALKKK